MLNVIKNEVIESVKLNVNSVKEFLDEVAYDGQLLSEVVGLVVATLNINTNVFTKYNTYSYLYEAEVIRLVTEWLIDNELIEIRRKVFKRTQDNAEPVYELIETGKDSKGEYVKEYSLPTADDHKIDIKGHKSICIKIDKKFFFNPTYRVAKVDERIITLYSFLKYIKNEDNVYDKYSYKEIIKSDEARYFGVSGIKMTLFSKKDSRGRSYPTLNMGIVSHYGDHFQSRLFEYAEERTVTQNDIDIAKWLLYVELNGRVPMSKALENFSMLKATIALKQEKVKVINAFRAMKSYNTLTRKESKTLKNNIITPNDLGDYLYKQNLYNLIKNGIGSTTRLMLEVDMTNSGLVILANNLKNSKMLKLANMVDYHTVYDSHGTLRDAMNSNGSRDFNRNDAKPINTALLHGGSITTMSKSSGIDVDTLASVLEDAYGIGYRVPNAIVKLNLQLIKKGITNPSWELPDGYVAYSTSYCTNVSVPTAHGNVKAIMPYYQYAHTDTVKISGLYANIIHSIDAFIMREVYNSGFDGLNILDKFKGSGDQLTKVINTVFELNTKYNNLLVDIVCQLRDKYDINIDDVLKLINQANDNGVAVNTGNFLSA